MFHTRFLFEDEDDDMMQSLKSVGTSIRDLMKWYNRGGGRVGRYFNEFPHFQSQPPRGLSKGSTPVQTLFDLSNWQSLGRPSGAVNCHIDESLSLWAENEESTPEEGLPNGQTRKSKTK